VQLFGFVWLFVVYVDDGVDFVEWEVELFVV